MPLGLWDLAINALAELEKIFYKTFIAGKAVIGRNFIEGPVEF